MNDVQLSKNFLLSELSRSDIAARLDIDNTPPPAIVEVLYATAGNLEVVRSILGEKAGRAIPLLVSSGFRCEALERVLCEKAYAAWCVKNSLMPSRASWKLYLERKQHPKGRAVDFTAPAFGTPLEVCRELERNATRIGFDQLIHEYKSWGHVGWAASQPRYQVLTIDAAGTHTGLLA